MVLDHYSILEVSRRASPEVIHAAYRSLAFQAKDDPKKLIVLNNSYSVLSDYDKKGAYDKDLNKKSKKIIGNYKIVSEIAFGGFGTTYKGEHLLLKTPVCIKHAHNVSPQT
jgi:curved DNA-binding protein CbpA